MQRLILRLPFSIHAMRAGQLPVIGGKDDQGVVRETGLVKERHNPSHLMVQGLAEAVVASQFLYRALAVLRRNVRAGNNLARLVQIVRPGRTERSVRRPPRQVAGEGRFLVPAHEVDGEVRLQRGLVVRLGLSLQSIRQRRSVVRESPWLVINVPAIEAFERLESATPPPGRNEAWLLGAVHMPFADVVSCVARRSQHVGPADLCRWQLQVVPDHAGLVRVAPGQNAGSIRRADRV